MPVSRAHEGPWLWTRVRIGTKIPRVRYEMGRNSPIKPCGTMADLDIRNDQEQDLKPDYTVGELILWMVGILSIPLVPILMSWFLTPWSGM